MKGSILQMEINSLLFTENPAFIECLEQNGVDEYGITTTVTKSFDELIEKLKANKYLIVSLSLNRQNEDQILEKIKIIRALTIVPIAILSEEPLDEPYRISVLEQGADHFFQLPMSNKEIAINSFALVRRFTEWNQVVNPTSLIYTHGMIINVNSHKVFIKGMEIDLTKKEFELLFLLVRNNDIVLSSERILNEAWNEKYVEGSTENVRKLIYELRKKIQIFDDLPEFIKTVHGVGYSFDPQYD